MAQKPGYAVNYIPQLQAEGLSANEALARLRDMGLGVRRQTFLRAWGETAAAVERSGMVARAPLDRSWTGEEYTDAARPKARGWLVNAGVAIKDAITGEVYFTPWGVRTMEPITYQEALNLAVQSFIDAAEGGRDSAPGQVLGATIESVLHLVPEDDADEDF